MRRPPAAPRGGLHLDAARARGRGPRRHVARHLLHGRVPDRRLEPPLPGPAGLADHPDPAGVDLPGHPGPAHPVRDGGRPAAAGQALRGLPQAVPGGAARQRARARRCTCSSGCRSRCWSAPAIFQLVTGVLNTAEWYAWSLLLPLHALRVAWVAFGALLLHVAVKLPVIRDAYRRPLEDGERPEPALDPPRPGARRARRLGRRRARGRRPARCPGSAGCRSSRPTSGAGPQDLPVTKSRARRPASPRRRSSRRTPLEVVHGGTDRRSLSLDRARGAAAAHRDAADRLRRGLERARRCGPACGCATCSTSSGRRAGTTVRGAVPPAARTVPQRPRSAATSPTTRTTLVALQLNGEPLSIDHGYPCRLIAPNRPGRAADQVGRPDRGDLMRATRGAARHRRGRAGPGRRLPPAAALDLGARRWSSLAVWLAGGRAAPRRRASPRSSCCVGVLVVPRLPSWSRAPVVVGARRAAAR